MTPGADRVTVTASRWPLRALLSLCLMVIAAGSYHFLDPGDGPKRGVIDFDAFYVAGQWVWEGRAADAYQFRLFHLGQAPYSDIVSFLPWTYPPQFDLVVAAFAWLPRPVAYLAFVLSTLLAFLAATRRLCGAEPVAALVPVLPAMLVALFCGQNGLMTGALIALAAAGLLNRRRWSGVALGLLVIKPHLALGPALYLVLDRRWGVIAAAAATVAATSLLTTILLGPGIWAAFAAGAADARQALAGSHYPFHRMVSVYASLYSLGAPAAVAMTVHVIAAVGALVLILFVHRRLGARDAIGFAICAGMLISPYLYDYDMPVFGVGLALLLTNLRSRSGAVELGGIAVLVAVSGGMGFAQSMGSDPLVRLDPVTIAGPLLLVAVLLIARILTRRQRQPATQASSSVRAMASGGGASQSPEPASAA